MLREPIKLTLYDTNDEEIRTEECRVVPWGMLKKALAIGTKKDTEQTFDGISDFVVELFKGRLTKTELEENADTGEVLAVFQTVFITAKNNIPNA